MLSVPTAEVLEEAARRGGRRRRRVAAGRRGLEFKRRSVVPAAALGSQRPGPRFDGVLRPDHVPTMEGDSNERAGYSSIGRLYAIGYIKGLREAVYAN